MAELLDFLACSGWGIWARLAVESHVRSPPVRRAVGASWLAANKRIVAFGDLPQGLGTSS